MPDLPENNPFQSPGPEDINVATNPHLPSFGLLVAGLIAGNTVNFISSISFYTDANYSVLARLFWVPIDLCYGLIYSLGLVVLIHSSYEQNLSKLMPGHWRLIAYLALITESVAWFVPWILIPLILGVFATTSKEAKIWKVHAWNVVMICLVDLVANLLSLYLQNYYSSMGDIGRVNYYVPWYSLVVLNTFIYLLNAAVLVITVLGIQQDIRQQTPRDNYHYLGLVLIMVLPLLHLVYRNFLSPM